jgi:hypothetical protein
MLVALYIAKKIRESQSKGGMEPVEMDFYKDLKAISEFGFVVDH